ncbi:hypothetical protein HMF7854_14760 [Sphingomonas ginkgonis]|uniref:Uncharacterized protein n=1 Tax=Sphingomonas ginkgonis TaxID=2315330 RepID=A0A3R9YKK1_9SPHN|nr:hypothetical protein [Sphingomonas ginkgonis]RST31958.1 hypothetical protein HMF7854_14760 [Sphingomonas ginkgonis]
MSRQDGELVAEGTANIGALLRSFGAPPTDRDRSEAIARFLSGEEGWEMALRQLGGTFATPAPGLRSEQEE